MLVTTLLATLIIRSAPSQDSNVVLLAATAMVANKPEVRLRWSMSKGWIPPGGYRLYRLDGTKRLVFQGGGSEKPRNTTLLRGKKTSIGKNPAQVLKMGTDIASLVQVANIPIALQSTLVAKGSRATSTKSLFRARASKSIELKGQPQVGPQGFSAGMNRVSGVSEFFDKISKAPKDPVLTGAALESEKTLGARRALILTSLARSEVATELGLGCTDKLVENGLNLSYGLFAVDGTGKETQVASCLHIVGKSPVPPAPLDVTAVQSGVGKIELRWDRLSDEEEDSLGITFYRVTRISSDSPQGKNLTPELLVVPVLSTDTGEVEPISFFVDNDAPNGSVTYKVELIDGFGRKSDAASVATEVADLRTPAAPNVCRAQLTGAKQSPPIQIIWSMVRETSVKYHVFRTNLDSNSAPERITPVPIDGSSLPVLSDIEAISFLERIGGAQSIKGASQTEKSRAVAATKAKSGSLRSFTDSSAEVDRRYKYAVRAVFSFNGRESSNSPEPVIEVPTLVTPQAPTGLQAGNFVPESQKPATIRSFSKSISGIEKQVNVIRNLKGPKLLPSANTLGPLKFVGEDIGGTIRLSWAPALGMIRATYKVFRQVIGQPATQIEIGQPKTNSFTDRLPRSTVIEYEYVVKCRNRWGIDGNGATARATAKSTLSPSTPNISSVSPHSTGALQIKWRTNPQEESVTTYKLFRKLVHATISKIIRPQFEEKVISRRSGKTVETGAKGKVSLRIQTKATSNALSAGQALDNPANSPESDQGYQLVATIALSGGQVIVEDGMAKYLDQAPNTNGRFFYKMVAVNELSMESDRSDPRGGETMKLAAVPPSNVSPSIENGIVKLVWTGSLDSVSYIVFRKAGSTWQQISPSISELAFLDKSAIANKTYRYRVVAIDKFGNVSPASSIDGVEIKAPK